MNFIDKFLNKITMYRVVLYSLTILTVIAIILNISNVLLPDTSSLHFISGLLILLASCFLSNLLFSKIFKAPTNLESSYITAYLLFFILAPVTSYSGLWMFVVVGVLAMASKYILAINRKHIFNPVAIALVIVGVFGSGIAIWWVATPSMLVPTLVLGLFVLRKVRKFTLFFSFLVPAIVTIFIFGIINGQPLTSMIMPILVSWPIIFFATFMLTEPQTTPPQGTMQIYYGVLVGILFGAQFHFGTVYSTPELALVFGNIFSYTVSPKLKLFLRLEEKKLVADNTYEFSFSRIDGKPIGLKFSPGQYLEWTMEDSKPDTRGNRRFFTIASSPTEETIKLGIRTTTVNPSSFKKLLVAMEKGGRLVATGLAGEFTLPRDPKHKLVFIAGGIGVTPFRSMAQYLLDTRESRDIVHLYSNKVSSDVAYKNIFDSAKEVGIKTVYALTDLQSVPADFVGAGEVGFINTDMILKHVPDFLERTFYISGPHGMVIVFERMLEDMGVLKSNIRSDFFPGFA